MTTRVVEQPAWPLNRVLSVAVLIVALALSASSASASTTPATWVGCGDGGDVIPKSRPGACKLDWPNLPIARSAYLRHLRWSSWGQSVATARADTRQKTYDSWTRVRVRAWGRRDCRGKAFVYTRVRVTWPNGGNRTWQTPNCTHLGFIDPE